jgi:RHS repeat-associated protein
MKYYPFGECRNSTGNIATDRLFTGQRLDSTGLYYYGARYYDPNIGRFISADTIVPDPMNPQSLSRYSYCLNNPLKYIDPTGHDDQLSGQIERWSDITEALDSMPKGTTVSWDERDGHYVPEFNLPGGVTIGGLEGTWELRQTPQQKDAGVRYLGKVMLGPDWLPINLPTYVVEGQGYINTLMSSLNASGISLGPKGIFLQPGAVNSWTLLHESWHFIEQSIIGPIWYASYGKSYIETWIHSGPLDFGIQLATGHSLRDSWDLTRTHMHDWTPHESRANWFADKFIKP